MKAKVIAGEVFGVRGPIVARTPAYFIDFIFGDVEKSYRHKIPAGWNSLIFLYSGSLQVQGLAALNAP
jgi:redox-sensitive bicupin YhaK (pirin superfamily)